MNSETIRASVLIIGAGAAGLRTAIELTERDVECLVMGKRRHGDAHTVMAAGGINASLGTHDGEDDWTIHAADTLGEGHMVCDPEAVELLARNAPDGVRELRAWGCEFNTTQAGEIDQRYFGAQSFRRTCFAGDRTGEAILETLVERARELRIVYRENVCITDILKGRSRVAGAAGFDLESGRHLVIDAEAVVIAAGGYTSIYARGTSRRDENTGDALALALAAGASLRDMEFVQFHPTGMVKPVEWSGRLVTEAVRGEGGRLFNARNERFMERYSPEQMELDARDVVARSIAREIREGRGTDDGGVYLDISHVDAETIRERLPKIIARFADLGINITREPMEVAPTAHYGMGGICVDFRTGETCVPGLYAVGEATAGVHGANRLGGNSLAETIVFGKITGQAIASWLANQERVSPEDKGIDHRQARSERFASAKGDEDPAALIDELRRIMWDHVGIIRNAEGLDEAETGVRSLRARANRVNMCDDGWSDGDVVAENLQCMIDVAEAVILSAKLREESRGAHFRSDHPEEADAWRRTIILDRADGALRHRSENVAAPSDAIRAALDAGHHLDYHHLE
jgi:succinate dehydrogenase / fumarate reductase, flavoprotein subunit